MTHLKAQTAAFRTGGRLALLALACAALQVGSIRAEQPGMRITPNFKDADLSQIIEAVSTATGRNIIIDPRVRAQVTLLSDKPMTPDQFYQAFLAILQVHGFVAVPSGNVLKILPDANMRQVPGNDLPEHVSATSDELVTQVLTVKSVSAAQLVPVLRPLIPQNGQLSQVTGTNLLIISDRAANVNRIMRIIARIDQASGSDIEVIPLQSATAADTVRVLNALITQGGEGGSNVKMVADDRSNSVLLSGDPSARLRIRTLIANLDTPLDTGGETNVRYLKYAKAEDLASKLKEQITSSGQGSGSTPNRGPNQAIAPAPTNAASAASFSLAGGTGSIWADKDTNALVITAPQRTMRAINAVIDKLDIRRAMVRVQAIIAEVSIDKTSDLGVNWVIDGSNSKLAVGGFIEPIGGTSGLDLYGLSKGTTTDLSKVIGTNIGIGRLAATGVNFGAIVRALQGDSRTNIISKPDIIARDNDEAKIEVGQEVPFVTGQYTGSTGTTSAFQTVQRQQVGTILTVTPQVNGGGHTILLKIQLESSSLQGTSLATSEQVTNKRTITTAVQIPDGETLVLGGLIQESATNSEQRVPFLGRIPLLGELFRTRDTGKKKTNLMVFIQPHIIPDDGTAILETNSKYDYIREEQRKVDHDSTILPLQRYQKIEPLPPLNQPTPAAHGTEPATAPTGSASPKPTASTPDAKPAEAPTATPAADSGKEP
jgi:general secretion pathway protein D